MTRKSRAMVYDQHTKYYTRNRLNLENRPVLTQEEAANMRQIRKLMDDVAELERLTARKQDILDELHRLGYTDDVIQAQLQHIYGIGKGSNAND